MSQFINKFGTKHAKEKKEKNYVDKVGQGEIIKTHAHTAHTHTLTVTHTHTHTTTEIDIENMKRNLMKQAESRRILVNVSKTEIEKNNSL